MMADQVCGFRLINRNFAFIFLIFNLSLFIYSVYVSNLSWPALKTPLLNYNLSSVGNNCTREHLNNVYIRYCDRKEANVSSKPCLCYADFHGPSMIAGTVKCAMTFQAGGRMGNRIGHYATMLVLAKLNRRPALVHPLVADFVVPYFKITIPVLTKEVHEGINWRNISIQDWMMPEYTNFEGLFTQIIGFTSSYTFFEDFLDEIRREFTLKDEIQERAEKVLSDIAVDRDSVTFVGVHVRRTDYIYYMKEWYNGTLADRNYFTQATAYFRSRYSDAVFLVVSDDMDWCKENIPNDKNDVIYIGNRNESDPITDFSLLMNCDHNIITIGTYGFFAALFAGGETVYLTNYTIPSSRWRGILRFDTAFPPHWHPIAADISSLQTKTPSIQSAMNLWTSNL